MITCARFRVLGFRVQGLGLTKMGLQRAVSVLDGALLLRNLRVHPPADSRSELFP